MNTQADGHSDPVPHGAGARVARGGPRRGVRRGARPARPATLVLEEPPHALGDRAARGVAVASRVPGAARPRSRSREASTCTAGILRLAEHRDGQPLQPSAHAQLVLELLEDQLGEMPPGGRVRRLRPEVRARRAARSRRAPSSRCSDTHTAASSVLAIDARDDGLGATAPSRRTSGVGTEPRELRGERRARARGMRRGRRSRPAPGRGRSRSPVRRAGHGSSGAPPFRARPLDRERRPAAACARGWRSCADRPRRRRSSPTLRWNSRSAASVAGPYTPSCLPGSKPSASSLRCKRAHVVPAEERRVQVQRAVTEAEPGFDELPPGVGADDPVGSQAALRLERANGLARLPRRTLRDRRSGRTKPSSVSRCRMSRISGPSSPRR